MVNEPKQRGSRAPRSQPPRPTKRMGEVLRTARDDLGLTMQAVGAAAEISPGYLFKLESGYVGTPSPRVLHRLAPVLGVDYWHLMSLADYVVPQQPGHALEERTPEPIPPMQRAVAALERMCNELSELHRQQALLLAVLSDRQQHPQYRTEAANPAEHPGGATT